MFSNFALCFSALGVILLAVVTIWKICEEHGHYVHLGGQIVQVLKNWGLVNPTADSKMPTDSYPLPNSINGLGTGRGYIFTNAIIVVLALCYSGLAYFAIFML